MTLMPSTPADRLQKLIDERRSDSRFDEELWLFLDNRTRTLRNVADEALTDRSRSVGKALLWLLDEPRDQVPCRAGYWSSWWWLRCWTQTQAELRRRDLTTPAPPDVAGPVALRAECRPVQAWWPVLWSRVGERQHLLDTLRLGRIRFQPAANYDDASLNDARRDNELERHRMRPSQSLIFTKEDGTSMRGATGDVRFTITTGPYWISCWSCELDPRLIDEFAAGDASVDSCIAVWDTEEMGNRIEAAAKQDLPGWTFADMPIQYRDPYAMEADPKLPVSMTKDISFAYQRELRLGLLPPSRAAETSALFIEIGSVEDIAGVYDRAGQKLMGSGPASLHA